MLLDAATHSIYIELRLQSLDLPFHFTLALLTLRSETVLAVRWQHRCLHP